MLNSEDAVATVAVKSVIAAAKFYEGKLGLKKVVSYEMQVLVYKSGNSRLLVYESQFAGTNKASAVTWVVDDVDGIVNELKKNGVTFERYDFPEVKHEGDVHVFGKRRTAWFTDPDGNILALANK